MKTIKYIPVIMALLLAGCNKYDIKPEQANGFIKFYTNDATKPVTAFDVKETADGGFVAVGTKEDANGFNDIYLIKTDKYGNEESWSPVILGGENDDVGTSLQVVSDGYVILGYSKHPDSTNYDLYLVKYDLQGNPVWETRRKFEDYDVSSSNLIVTSSGSFLASGVRHRGTGSQQYLLAEFGMNGEYVGNELITPANPIDNIYLIETQDFYVICGTELAAGKNQINIIPCTKDFLNPTGGGYLKASGTLTGTCIQELSDGNLIISGTVQNITNGLNEIYLNKIAINSTSGGLEEIIGWDGYQRFAEPENAGSLSGNSIRIVNDNSYAIIGTRTITGNDDIILLFADASGLPVSRIIFGDDGFQQGISLELTGSDGGLILVGNNGAEDYSMMALVKTDAEGKL
ncbi:hypothetical protein ACFLTA_05950 [Bacteroidota bacterium]